MVHLGSTIEMACSLEVLLVVQWELHVVSAGSVDEEVHILPATVLANQTDLIIPPMTLKVGNYRVLLRVSLQDEDGDTIRGEDAEGWMVVERSDLVAHIDGGSQRTVGMLSIITVISMIKHKTFGDHSGNKSVGQTVLWYPFTKCLVLSLNLSVK